MKRIVTVEIPEGERCSTCQLQDDIGYCCLYGKVLCLDGESMLLKCQACLDADKEKASD